MQRYLAPSLMCMDITDTKNNLAAFEKYAKMLHIDIMDGHFAKNITLSPDFIKFIRPHTALPIDAHMMVEYPLDYIDALKNAGADYISVHAEAITRNSFRVINKIIDCDVKLGIALCPASPIETITPYIETIDMLTIMSVEVGYSGQKFIPQMLDKIEAADRLRKEKGYKYLIQVDGNVGAHVYKVLYDRNVDVYAMGSNMFKGEADPMIRCERLHKEFCDITGAKE